MDPWTILLLLVLGGGLVVVLWKFINKQWQCPFCKAKTIDLIDAAAAERDTLLKVIFPDSRKVPASDQIRVCRQCRTVHDCRPFKDKRIIEAERLEIDDFRCRECGNRVIKEGDASLDDRTSRFIRKALDSIKDERTDRPAYLCFRCGCVNIWEKDSGSEYTLLTARPDLGLYPESEYAVRKRKAELALEEISLIDAKWVFEEEYILATPPNAIVGFVSECSLKGEFRIDLKERMISCGKPGQERRWVVDDTWQVGAIGELLLSEDEETRTWTLKESKRVYSSNHQVRLYSRENNMSFVIHEGRRYECEDFARRVGETLGLTASTEKTEKTRDPWHS